MTTILKRRAVAAAAVVLTAAGVSSVVAATAADAGTSTLFTITGVSVHRLPALTANQVITITGTGFDQNKISNVAIDSCTAGTYIVQNTTTMLFKTDNTCTASSTGVITITDTSSNTAVSIPGATGGKQALAFVTAPTIKTASDTARPVMTDNTAGIAYGSQITQALVTGGTAVRVYSGSVPFINTTAYKLAATLDGVALTGVTLTGSTAGNYFTGIAGAHAADAAPVLSITNNGVTKSFAYGAGGGSAVDQTFDFAYAGSSVKVSPAFGPTAGGTKLTVTGSGFSASTPTTVTVGGVSCPKLTGTTITSTTFVCTVPAVTAAGPVSVVATTGSAVTVIGSGSTFTYVSQ